MRKAVSEQPVGRPWHIRGWEFGEQIFFSRVQATLVVSSLSLIHFPLFCFSHKQIPFYHPHNLRLLFSVTPPPKYKSPRHRTLCSVTVAQSAWGTSPAYSKLPTCHWINEGVNGSWPQDWFPFPANAAVWGSPLCPGLCAQSHLLSLSDPVKKTSPKFNYLFLKMVFCVSPSISTNFVEEGFSEDLVCHVWGSGSTISQSLCLSKLQVFFCKIQVRLTTSPCSLKPQEGVCTSPRTRSVLST